VSLVPFIAGVACGLAVLVPLLRRVRAHADAARAMERSAHVDLCVARERHSGELQSARSAHEDELGALRERFGLEVRTLREAVSSARAELDRTQGIELLIARVAQTVERVERELARIDRRPRLIRR
jgi:hypothetical protein